MNEQSYFIITAHKTGDIKIRSITTEELQKYLKDVSPGIYCVDKYSTPLCWGENALLIKGEVVIPKPKNKGIKNE